MLEQFGRNGAGSRQGIVGEAHIEVEFVAFEAIADIAIEAPDVGRREIAEAVVVNAFERSVDRPVVVDLLAPLRRAVDAAE